MDDFPELRKNRELLLKKLFQAHLKKILKGDHSRYNFESSGSISAVIRVDLFDNCSSEYLWFLDAHNSKECIKEDITTLLRWISKLKEDNNGRNN